MEKSSEEDAPKNFSCEQKQDVCKKKLSCKLCGIKSEKFICFICIKSGNFIHSSSSCGAPLSKLSQKFSEKQEKHKNIKLNLNKQNEKCEISLIENRNKENLKFEVKLKREKISILRQLIEETREKIKQGKKFRDQIRESNVLSANILPKYEDKVKKLEDYVGDRIQQIQDLKGRNSELIKELKIERCNEIQKLIKYIFPITEIIIKDEISCTVLPESSNSSGSTISTLDLAALADAKNTSYIRGKWVFHGSGISEMQYQIVGPSLPANGDYSSYSNWILDKDDSKANEIIPSRVTAYRIIGALTYTTQLTNLLSFFLNIRLPYKLNYGDFSKKLNDQQFVRRVSRLNSNILYLAYTQSVKLNFLNENHTLENILAILNIDHCDLGRMGPNDINNVPLMDSIDSILLVDTATESESEDENSLRLDAWEAVPEQQEIISQQQQQKIPLQQTQSIMSTAANSIASIFRGWTK